MSTKLNFLSFYDSKFLIEMNLFYEGLALSIAVGVISDPVGVGVDFSVEPVQTFLDNIDLYL